MTEDYPELPDFLNRKLNPITPQHGVVLRRKAADRAQIVWPKKQIDRALKAKARAAKAARKAKLKKQRELLRRG